jgi:hypothetical protein
MPSKKDTQIKYKKKKTKMLEMDPGFLILKY